MNSPGGDPDAAAGTDGVVIGTPDPDVTTPGPDADPAPDAASTQPQGFCAEAGDGEHCQQGVLIGCAGGAKAAETPCPFGCIAAPGDLPDVCAVDPDGGGGAAFCADKPDGDYCELGALVTCLQSQKVASSPCPLGCLSSPPACVTEAGDDFCAGKADGAWCGNDALIHCVGGEVGTKIPCDLGCIPAPPGEPDKCTSQEDQSFCAAQPDGASCDGDVLFTCQAGALVGQMVCLHGCISTPGQPDICGPGAQNTWCTGKPDGDWCKGSTLVTCAAAAIAAELPCPFGCQGSAAGAFDVCAPDASGDFCAGKQSGAWCYGDDLATCQADKLVGQVDCPWGCLSMPVGTADQCAAGQFCMALPPMTSASPPSEACNYMDWKLSPDGFYLISQFGTTNDPTTLGNSTSCGFLQSQYNAKGCKWDNGTGGCLGGSHDIPWIQGHVDYSYQQVLSTVSANMNGDVPAPEYFYVAGAQRFGCGAVLRITNTLNGRCVVAYVEDGGPGSKYESAPYGGRRIMDSSPAVVQYLQVPKLGWKSSTLVLAEWGQPGDVPGQACSPCDAATPAKQGTESQTSPWDLTHMVPSCGTSDGSGGLSCPSGNGLYCGSGVGLEAGTLYSCQNGTWTPHEDCANGCQQSPPGVSDACAIGPDGGDECPSGDGLYCGSTAGLDADTLYYCSAGTYAPAEVCATGCVQAPPGQPDACKDPGSGTSKGKLLLCNPFSPPQSVTCGYGCYSGHKGSDYAVPNGTPVYSPITGTVTKVVDTVTGQTCSGNFGSYVKIQQGAFEVILAHMNPNILVDKDQPVAAGTQIGLASNTGYTLAYKGGAWVCMQGGGYHLHMETRKNGAAFDPFSSSNVQWVSECGSVAPPDDTGFCVGKQNGLWCDGDDLVSCQGGVVSSALPCPSGCVQMPVGTPDECAASSGSCSNGNGLYCGSSAGKAPDTLYNCNNGAWSVVEVCGNGCVQMPAGTSDKCADGGGGSCPSGNGLYCGGSVGKDVNTLYSCQSGVYTVQENCSKGCLQMPSGTSDQCNDADPPPGCPSGNGLYCGGSVGKDANTLYSCQNGVYTVQENCSNGCQQMPSGTSDQCKDNDPPPSCPSGNGLYCGASVGKDSSKLYKCVSGVYTVQQSCSNGCQQMPSGTSDQCKDADPPPSCPSGNGLYCGASVGKDSSKLYKCVSGVYTVQQSCSNGCQQMPSGTSDQCKDDAPPPSGCPSGNGLYCGGPVGKDSSTLYNCSNGSYSFNAHCAAGCNVAPPGQSDSCKSGSCPSGNGAYCGQSVGLSSKTLYNCSNGKYTVKQNCGGTCKVAPPGQPDTCP